MRKGLALFAGFAVMLAGAGAVAGATATGAAASEEVLVLVDSDEDVTEEEKLDLPDKGQQGGMTCCWVG